MSLSNGKRIGNTSHWQIYALRFFYKEKEQNQNNKEKKTFLHQNVHIETNKNSNSQMPGVAYASIFNGTASILTFL